MRTPYRYHRGSVPAWPVALAALVLCCLPITPASAANVSVTNGELSIVDTVGENNIIDLLPSSPNAYDVVDQGVEIVPGPGCTAVFTKIVHCEMVSSIRVAAGAGNDLIGLQNATVPVRAAGEAGEDLLEAGSTPSVMDGGDGIDSVVGGAATDALSGGAGNDLLVGGQSADAMRGGTGDDILEGTGGGADVINGEGGRDLLRGGTGNESLNGGSGDDVIVGGAGRDSIQTGTGRDNVFAASMAGASDTIACTPGDVVHAGMGDRTTGCNASMSTAPAAPPIRWPPAMQTVRSAIVAPDPRLFSALRLPGNAQRYTVKVAETEDYPLRVRVFIYTAGRVKVADFQRTVRTMHPSTFRLSDRLRKLAVLIVVRRTRA